MPRSLKTLAVAGAVIALFGTSACATAEEEALLFSFLGLAADVAVADYMLDNCSFYSNDYGYGQYTVTDCRDRGRDHHHHRGDD